MIAVEYAKIMSGPGATASPVMIAPQGAQVKRTSDGRQYAEVGADQLMNTVLSRGIM